jgi:hypothetical protein
MARAADEAGLVGALAEAGGVTTARAVEVVGADGADEAAEAGAEAVALGTAEGAFETTGGAIAVPELPVPVVPTTFEGSATGPLGEGGELTRVTRMAMTTAASAIPAPVTRSFTGLLATSESARVVASAGEDEAMLRPSAGASLPLGACGLGWVTFANS